MALQIGGGSGGGSGGGMQVGGFKAPSRAVSYNSPTKWLGNPTDAEAAQSAANDHVLKAFQSLPAENRTSTLLRLQAAAKAGDQSAARNLAVVAPEADKNVPTDPNYTDNSVSGKAFRASQTLQKGLGAVVDMVSGSSGQTAGDENVQRGKDGKVTSVQGGRTNSLQQQAEDAIKARLLLATGPSGSLLKTVASNAAIGGGYNLADSLQKGSNLSDTVASTAEGAAIGGAGGAALHGLTSFFGRGAKAAMAEAKANMSAQEAQAAAARTAAAATSEKPVGTAELKLLSDGKNKLANDSTAVIPGTPGVPATATHLPVSGDEYTQRFNDISKSFDKQTAAAEKIKSPLQQKAVLDQIHDSHQAQIEQLNHEFNNGKPNPDAAPAVPGTPDTTIPTGFTMGQQAATDHAAAMVGKGQRQQVHIRIGQIDKIIQDAANNGTRRSPDELRALLKERQAGQDVLDGKASFETTYPQKTAGGPVADTVAAPAAPGDAGPIASLDTKLGAAADVPLQHQLNMAGTDSASIISHAPTVRPGDTTQPILNRNYVMNKTLALKDAVNEASKGMSPHDIALLDHIESDAPNSDLARAHLAKITAAAENPEQFAKVVDAMRHGYDTRLAGDLSLGRDMNVRHNYLPHMFDNTDAATAKALEDRNAIVTAGVKPGYTKPRSFDTYAQALAYKDAQGNGLKRLNANALEDFSTAMDRAAQEHGSQALLKGLNEAHPGQVAVGKIGTNIANGDRYKGLDIAGGQNFSMPQDLANHYNARAASQPASGALGAYDKTNALLKYAKLGGGTFHAMTTALTTSGQQLASGEIFKHPQASWDIIKGTLSPAQHEQNMLGFAERGTLENAHLSGVTLGSKEITADIGGNLVDKMQNGKYNPIRAVHSMVFERQIPEAKLTMFEQATKGLDPNVPADLVKMRSAATAVNNLGGINRAVQGLTPKTAKNLSRFVLATDFTEGKFRTLGAALAKGGNEGKIARQMVVGKTIVAAVPGLTALTMSGQLDWNDPKSIAAAITDQVLDPSIQTPFRTAPSKSNPNGTPKTAKLPSTFISELGKVIKPALDPLSPDKLKGLKDYVTNRSSAIIGTGSALIQNKDFNGNPILGNDKNGNPQSIGKQALNVADQVLPIPIVQGNKSAFGGQSLAESALNTAGFRVTADPNSAEGAHSAAVGDFYNTLNGAQTARSKASKQVTSLVGQGKLQQAQRVAEEYNATIDNRLAPFKQKYASNYNPAWDDNFKTLAIPTTGRAFEARTKAYEKSQAVLK